MDNQAVDTKVETPVTSTKTGGNNTMMLAGVAVTLVALLGLGFLFLNNQSDASPLEEGEIVEYLEKVDQEMSDYKGSIEIKSYNSNGDLTEEASIDLKNKVLYSKNISENSEGYITEEKIYTNEEGEWYVTESGFLAGIFEDVFQVDSENYDTYQYNGVEDCKQVSGKCHVFFDKSDESYTYFNTKTNRAVYQESSNGNYSLIKYSSDKLSVPSDVVDSAIERDMFGGFDPSDFEMEDDMNIEYSEEDLQILQEELQRLNEELESNN